MNANTLELGQQPINSDTVSLFSGLLEDMFIIIILLALAWVVIMSFKGSTSDPSSQKGAKDAFKKILVAFFALFSVSAFAFLNPRMVSGTIGFSNISGSTTNPSTILQGINGSTGYGSGSTPVTPGTCQDPNVFISDLKSGGGVCGAITCTTACTLSSSILSLVQQESSKYGVNYKAIAALICRESGGNQNTIGSLNTNGTQDCGLMQINKPSGGCTGSIMDPLTNIDAGIELFKQKLSAVSSLSYQGGVTKEMMAFAAYNCCSNGDNPNSQSVDCSTSSNFPYPVPKWACPINPGNGPFNMCNVKSYACGISACMQKF